MVGASYGSYFARRNQNRHCMLWKSRYSLAARSGGLICSDFDFGVEQMMYLVQQCGFPWLIGNVFDGNMPLGGGLQTYILTACNGIKIGCIGLVEKYLSFFLGIWKLIVGSGWRLLIHCRRI